MRRWRGGVEWLLDQQKKNGSFVFTAIREQLYANNPLGETLLSMLALLSCEVPHDHPALQRAAEFVLNNPSRSTYEAGLTLMAFDLKGAPPWEKKAMRRMPASFKKNYKFPRLFSAKERERIQADADFLINSWGNGYWFYGKKTGPRGDISNTQFAILGLRSASRSGIYVPEEIFYGLMGELLRSQQPKGPKVVYEHLVQRNAWDKPYILSLQAEARGWGYFNYRQPAKKRGSSTKPFPDVTGSRTCIGLATLAICRDELLRRGSDEAINSLRVLEPKMKIAVRDGLGWLNKFFSVKANPGTKSFGRLQKMPMHGYWYYYYLYALERVGVLIPTRFVGLHDWYLEGTKEVLKRQKKNGAWVETNNLVDTCFALLFLRRATIPSVYTFSGTR